VEECDALRDDCPMSDIPGGRRILVVEDEALFAVQPRKDLKSALSHLLA
jgi:hypothetical protein